MTFRHLVVASLAAESVGRLFDYSNPFNPIDRGLYEMSFVITFAPKPPKGKGKG
jgi:hypothetical protein